MRKEEFYQRVYEETVRRLSDCYEKDEIILEKRMDNGRSCMALNLRKKGSLCTPSFNLDDYFAKYLIMMPEEEYLAEIERIGRLHIYNLEKNGVFNLDSFEDISDRVEARLVALKNADSASEVYSLRFDYFIAEFRIDLENFGRETCCMAVSKKQFLNWGISDETLLDTVCRNQLRDGIILSPLHDARISDGFQLKNNYWESPPSQKEAQNAGLLVLTNPFQCWGASLILNLEVLKKIYMILGVDYYIFPSSIHEVMILADSGNYDVEKFSSLIRRVNESDTEPMDILADEVFFYDSAKGRLITGKEHAEDEMSAFAGVQDMLLAECFGTAGL